MIRRLGVRLTRVLIVALGAVLAAVMCVAGVWQMDVYRNKGQAELIARSQQPPVPLEPLIEADQTAFSAYGIQVSVTGHYVASQQFYVGFGGQQRVLTAFVTDSGRTLAVVRGLADSASVPPPPSGTVTAIGVFLPGEQTPDATASGPLEPRLAAVQLGTLAQVWEPPIVSGFLTLSSEAAAAQGLTPAGVTLPEGRGSTQNLSYAMQWWAFAVFALVMSVIFARQVGREQSSARQR